MKDAIVAAATDRDVVASMLARAFHDDPAFGYIFPDPAGRARGLYRLFRLLFDSDGRAGMKLATAGGEAATLWRAPGRAGTGWGEMLAHALPLALALGGGIARALRVASAIEAHMPAGPFWYLHMVGCEPTLQRRGFGSAAIRGGLDAVGSERVYLETAAKGNIGLYEHLGFAITGEWQVEAGGPRFWSMLKA